MKQSKMDLLKSAFLNGETLSPLDAFIRWRMQANTFNRSIFDLKNYHGLQICSRRIDTEESHYNVHWIDNPTAN